MLVYIGRSVSEPGMGGGARQAGHYNNRKPHRHDKSSHSDRRNAIFKYHHRPHSVRNETVVPHFQVIVCRIWWATMLFGEQPGPSRKGCAAIQLLAFFVGACSVLAYLISTYEYGWVEANDKKQQKRCVCGGGGERNGRWTAINWAIEHTKRTPKSEYLPHLYWRK